MKFFLASLFSIAAILSILYLHCFHCGYRDVSFQYLQVSILFVSSALHERDREKLEMLQTDDTSVWDLGTLLGEQEGRVRNIHQCLRWKPKSPLFLAFGITHNAVVWSLCKGRTDTDGLPPCGSCIISSFITRVLGLTLALLLCWYH